MRSSQITAAATVLGCLLVGGPLLGQGAWSRVPAAPTSCFADDDTYLDKAEAVRSALSTEISAQREYRSELQEKMRAIDIMTQSQRMAAFLQKNPDKAQEYMKMAGAGEPPPDAALLERGEKLGTRFDELKEDFKTQFGELAYLATRSGQAYELSRESPRGKQLLEEYNGKYQKLCESQILSGPFADWLRDMKQYHVDMAKQELNRENVIKMQAEIMGVPNAGFKPIADPMHASDYIQQAVRVYSLRIARLKPPV